MATDGPTPPACNDDVYKDGEVVFVTNSIPSNAMERWVKSVAKDSKQPVDWHFMGGRAVIKALGDLNAVKASMRKLMPNHDKLFENAIGEVGRHEPPRPDWWNTSTN